MIDQDNLFQKDYEYLEDLKAEEHKAVEEYDQMTAWDRYVDIISYEEEMLQDIHKGSSYKIVYNYYVESVIRNKNKDMCICSALINNPLDIQIFLLILVQSGITRICLYGMYHDALIIKLAELGWIKKSKTSINVKGYKLNNVNVFEYECKEPAAEETKCDTENYERYYDYDYVMAAY